jgi:energy-coupling factor transporter ATP-binding protein EcfA2
MIRKLTIENFKSIERLEVELGRVNVLIGENGSGKSNLLEAIAFASAAAQDKLDNEFLASRGIRVTEPRFMRAAFSKESATREIFIVLENDLSKRFECRLTTEDASAQSRWVNNAPLGLSPEMSKAFAVALRRQLAASDDPDVRADTEWVIDAMEGKREEEVAPILRIFRRSWQTALSRGDFLIYSPENTALRTFQSEGQILPLGIKGEGLFAHLKALVSEPNRERLTAIMEKLQLIDWFDRFDIPGDLGPGEHRLRIGDRYLDEGLLFDQRSANEGFLFLLFYFTLFISPDTPAFFAIDNVDASLNPRLCSALVLELCDLAKTHDKQTILTTHNPAVLDGLDLHDDEQRLFVVQRNTSGHTKLRRIGPPTPLEGDAPIRLSEAFLRGYLGGLPNNF